MKRLAILFLLFSFFINAQEEAFTIKNPYRNLTLNPKETFVIEDETSGNFAVFMISSTATYAFLYDKDFNKLKHLRSTKLPSKYRSFQGYTIYDNTYTFLMNTPNNRSYGVVTFNFDTGSYETYESPFKLKKERLLTTISHRNTSYLITISKKEDELIIYSFNENWDTPNRRGIAFDGAYFKEETNNNYTFKELFFDKFRVKTIPTESPVSIKEASGKIKIYSNGTAIKITSNKYSEKTFILDFDLIEDKKKVSSIDMPLFEREGFVPKSNSFLIDTKLFQARANNLKLAFNIIDIESGTILNRFDAKKKVPITFNNGPIIQKKTGVFKEERDIKTTAAFLRKLQNMDLGVSVYKDKNSYVFNMGGYSEEQGSGLIFIPGGGFIGGAIGGLATSFLTYNYSKSLMIAGVLDNNLKHKDGVVKENLFEVISNFSSQKKTKAETLFENQDTYYWGTYSKKYDHYTFYSFKK